MLTAGLVILFGSLFIAVTALSVRAFKGLRREAQVRRKHGQSSILEALVAFYPFGVVLATIGIYFVYAVVALSLAALLFTSGLVVASKQRKALECTGTDEAAEALEATSSATLSAIVGWLCVVLAGTFILLARSIASQTFGA